MRSNNSEEASYAGDAWEIFTQLIILVVEGRTPGGEKGYHAGPHCPQPQQLMGNRHICEPAASVVSEISECVIDSWPGMPKLLLYIIEHYLKGLQITMFCFVYLNYFCSVLERKLC